MTSCRCTPGFPPAWDVANRRHLVSWRATGTAAVVVAASAGGPARAPCSAAAGRKRAAGHGRTRRRRGSRPSGGCMTGSSTDWRQPPVTSAEPRYATRHIPREIRHGRVAWRTAAGLATRRSRALQATTDAGAGNPRLPRIATLGVSTQPELCWSGRSPWSVRGRPLQSGRLAPSAGNGTPGSLRLWVENEIPVAHRFVSDGEFKHPSKTSPRLRQRRRLKRNTNSLR